MKEIAMPVISERRLRAILGAAFAAFDLPEAHLAFVVDGLVEASLRGVDTHGVRLARTYLQELRHGRARARPQFREHARVPAAVRLDADDALGVVAGNVATEIAIRRARECGIAAVAVANSNHFGAAALYPLKMAAAGMVGMCFSNADALVAPVNGITRMLGTNPISFAAPGLDDEVYCMDMATSQIAYSKVKQTIKEGRAVPPGWCVDQAEEDVVLLPLGGYKGQGLALMVQILSSLLSGMMFDHEMDHLYESASPHPRKVGHFLIAIDIAAFVDPAEFTTRLHRLLADVRGAPSLPGTTIRVAGDRARETRAERLVSGIPMSEEEFQYFHELAVQFGFDDAAAAATAA
jgi:LDH2 family malate/lactate/ureidoglycolate dehydrogenase